MTNPPTQPGQFMMLPPAPDKCQICAVKHDEDQPHNRDSLFYQFWFNATYGRSATWADAMLHCSDEIKQQWLPGLRAVGVSEEKIGEVNLSEEGDSNA